MLKLVIDAARAARVSLSLCGDMAEDSSLTWILAGLGLRELSMDPDRIPLVKAVVRGSSLAEAEDLAGRASMLDSPVEIADSCGLGSVTASPRRSADFRRCGWAPRHPSLPIREVQRDGEVPHSGAGNSSKAARTAWLHCSLSAPK